MPYDCHVRLLRSVFSRCMKESNLVFAKEEERMNPNVSITAASLQKQNTSAGREHTITSPVRPSRVERKRPPPLELSYEESPYSFSPPISTSPSSEVLWLDACTYSATDKCPSVLVFRSGRTLEVPRDAMDAVLDAQLGLQSKQDEGNDQSACFSSSHSYSYLSSIPSIPPIPPIEEVPRPLIGASISVFWKELVITFDNLADHGAYYDSVPFVQRHAGALSTLLDRLGLNLMPVESAYAHFFAKLERVTALVATKEEIYIRSPSVLPPPSLSSSVHLRVDTSSRVEDEAVDVRACLALLARCTADPMFAIDSIVVNVPDGDRERLAGIVEHLLPCCRNVEVKVRLSNSYEVEKKGDVPVPFFHKRTEEKGGRLRDNSLCLPPPPSFFFDLDRAVVRAVLAHATTPYDVRLIGFRYSFEDARKGEEEKGKEERKGKEGEVECEEGGENEYVEAWHRSANRTEFISI